MASRAAKRFIDQGAKTQQMRSRCFRRLADTIIHERNRVGQVDGSTLSGPTLGQLGGMP
jgi:hypothetical protein